MVISIDTEKHLIKFNMHSRVNNRTEMAEESKLEDRLWENIKSEENSVKILRKNEPRSVEQYQAFQYTYHWSPRRKGEKAGIGKNNLMK